MRTFPAKFHQTSISSLLDMNLFAFSLLTLLHFFSSIDALDAGHVFAIKAIAPDHTDIDGRPFYVYGDNTVGLHDPYNDVAQFQGVIMPEYGIVFQPEPCMVLKLSDRNIFTVSNSLYNPSVGFYEENGLLKNNQENTRFVVCPTWNEVLLVDDGKVAICDDAVEVQLAVTVY